MDKLRFLSRGPPESDIEKHDLGYVRTGSGWGGREAVSEGWPATFGDTGYESRAPLLGKNDLGHLKTGSGWGEGEALSEGWLAAFGTSGYEGEMPLLEELDIDFSQIRTRVGEETIAALNPFSKADGKFTEEGDFVGPILYYLLFSACLLLVSTSPAVPPLAVRRKYLTTSPKSGNDHFGYIYSLAVFGSISLHLILRLMSPLTSGLRCIGCASVLGYCLLPLVFSSLVGIAFPMNCPVGYAVNFFAVAWCTRSASNILTAVLRLEDMQLLVAYPLGLFYSVFAVVAVFGSAGSAG